MTHKNKHAFTLIELIVSITILAVLATIAFLSFGWHTSNARNSTRIADIKTIDKAFSLFSSVETVLPLPDNPESVTYSGSLAWTQGTFGKSAAIGVWRISNVPTDPTKWIEYTYSTSNNRTKYQIGAALEAGLFSADIWIIPQTHALSGDGMTSYNMGNYTSYDINATNGSECYLITAPSIMLSDIPSTWALSNNIIYNFSYNNSSHLPSSYSGFIDETTWVNGYQIVEVFDECSMNTIGDLELYLAQLSTAYQPLASLGTYDQIIYETNKVEFQLQTIKELQRNGISIDQNVIDTLVNPILYRTFADPFSNTDGTQLVASHMPSPLESWSMTGASDISAYTIESNRLEKKWRFKHARISSSKSEYRRIWLQSNIWCNKFCWRRYICFSSIYW